MAINLKPSATTPTAQLIADTGLFFGPLDPENGYQMVAARSVQLAPGALPATLTTVIPGGVKSGRKAVPVSAALEINSIAGALLLPRLTNAQMTASTFVPTNGMLVYQIGGTPGTNDALYSFSNGAWSEVASGGASIVFTDNYTPTPSPSGNFFVGRNAGNGTLSGAANVAVSYDSGISLTSGSGNTFYGIDSGTAVTSTSIATAIGFQSLLSATSATGTTAVGFLAAGGQLQYTDCTFIGNQAEALVNNLTNSTAIGNNATVSVSNGFVLGNNSVHVGIRQQSPAYIFDIGADNQTLGAAGGIRFADNINIPTTPGNVNDLVLFNQAGFLNLLNHSGTVTTLASFSTLTPGTYDFADLVITAGGGITVSSNGIDTGLGGNLFLGKTAGNGSISGAQNIGIGYSVMTGATSAAQNTALGYEALASISSGVNNIAIGDSTLTGLQTGSAHTVVGTGSAVSLVGDSFLCVLGSGSFAGLTSGDNNVGVGGGIGASIATANDCTFIGHESAATQTTATGCTLIGAFTVLGNDSLSEATAIGFGATVTQSNQIMLGTNQEFVTMPGGVQYATTSLGSATLSLDSIHYFVGVHFTVANPVSITLPTASADFSGQAYVIKDTGDNASVNNITITVSGGGNIDFAASLVMNTNAQTVRLICDGTQWWTM